MPTYEYRRQDGTVFEVFRKMSDPPLSVDPETGQPVTQVFSAPAVHFKGPGFYTNDVGTAKGNRELERAAEQGADAHDQKMADQRKQKAAASAAAAKKAQERRQAARVSSQAPPSTAPTKPPRRKPQ